MAPMARPPQTPTRPDLTAAGRPDTPPCPIAAAALSDDQVRRWAELIADGRGEVPDDLPPADRDRLGAAAIRRLRDRLVRHIARAVAREIHRDARTRQEDDRDA